MIRRVTTFMMLLCLARGAQAGLTQARYLVFEVDRFDAVTLSAAEDVMLEGDLESVLDSRSGGDDSDRVDLALRDANGRETYRTSVVVDRHIRSAEVTPDGSIACRWIELDRTPFVVRVPRGGETVELFVRRSGRVSQFAVRAPAGASGTSPVAIGRDRPEAQGSPANRLDLLVVGDGYTSAEQAKFGADVERVTAQFFSIEPYHSYRNFVNVTSYFVASPQSGADHPVCADGGPDPLEGTYVDTAFDATYCSGGLQRLLVVSTAKVLAAAAAVPGWDKIMVLVNDSLYGGAGGSVMVTSTSAAAVPVVQHEFGHTFTRLADEYSSPYPGYPTCSDISGRSCEPNVTNQTLRASIKWAPWIAASTPVPTPEGSQGVGLFLGARYLTTGMYRPETECMMKALDSPFCHVCAQSFVLSLYDGWGGVPAQGIDLIDDVTPAPGTIQVAKGTPVTFSATLLKPGDNMPRVQWLVDGAVVPGATSAAFVYEASGGTHTVELRVSDPTSIVHPDMSHGALQTARIWSVQGGSVRKRRAVGH